MASHEQVRKVCQHVALAAVLQHAPKTGLLEPELPLPEAERMLACCTPVSLGCLGQIIQPPFWWIGECIPHTWAHRHPEADRVALHLFSLLDLLVGSVGAAHGLVPMQELLGWSQVMDGGSSCLHSVDEAVGLVHSAVDLHTVAAAFRVAV